MAQAPRLERAEQGSQFYCGGPDFLLVVHKSGRFVVGNGIVVLGHVGQHSQEPVTLCLAGLLERAILGSEKQRRKTTAMADYKSMQQ